MTKKANGGQKCDGARKKVIDKKLERYGSKMAIQKKVEKVHVRKLLCYVSLTILSKDWRTVSISRPYLNGAQKRQTP